MVKENNVFKKIMVSVLILCMMFVSVPAFAWHGGGGGHHGGYYRGGRGMGPWGWFGVGMASALVAGAIVESVNQPRVVVYNGVTYYTDGTYYYQQVPQGYVVVNAPVVVDQPIVINITNTNGSITPVTLTRRGSAWVGPQGEVYTTFPTEAQLRVMYGK